MTGDIRSSWVDVITAAQTRSYNNMAVFWSYFRDFVGGRGGGGGESRIYPNQIFFRRSISNNR